MYPVYDFMIIIIRHS